MRKLVAIGSLVFGLALPASARSPRPQVDTSDFAVEICTSTTISISNSSAVDVIAGGVALGSATYIEVFNVDASTSIACAFDSTVSIAPTSKNMGRAILPQIGLGILANIDKLAASGYWCLSSGAAAVRATITKCR